ncbi:MAG TPA: carbon-nitrogen hydrolase family protein [Candidatus Kapabacteria bacterium]|nr:carbon-nitrogen hydrolase family protein [Candidatus Kapabacteria bacterium]
MRKVRIATASFLIEDTPHTVEQNFTQCEQLIMDAAWQEADILCLPETVLTNNVPDGHELPEDFPGRWTELFQAAAKEHGIAIVAPFFARREGLIVNQATLIDNNGEVAGSYRKLQPTGWEARFVTPGDDLPVLDLAFGKIAIMICMDIYFPEIARIYAMKGAEVLFWPTTTHGPTQPGLEAQLRSRAIDNSLTIVESNLVGHAPYAPYAGRFYPGNARIMDHDGEIISQTGRRHGLAIADIDLDEPRRTHGVFLINEPDNTREDLESLTRMDLYAREYASLAQAQHRFYDKK